MKAFLVMFVALAHVLPVSVASEAGSCKARRFPFARQQSKKDFKQLLDTLPRQDVQEYFFHELTAKPKKESGDRLGYTLGQYLIHTEPNKNLRSLYYGFAWATHLNQPQGEFKALQMKEVCQLLSKAKAAPKPASSF